MRKRSVYSEMLQEISLLQKIVSQSYAYTYRDHSSDLYVVSGLK